MHMNDAPYKETSSIPIALIKFIVQTMTKNSTTKGRLCERIAAEDLNTLAWQSVFANTVYRALKQERYSVFKKSVNPSLTVEQIEARLEWCYKHRHYN